MATAFERIRDQWVPEWLKAFERKAKDYNESLVPGVENADILGVRGQYADIWRKIGKLKKALWDGQPLAYEQPLEVIDDLIAHLFLTRDMLLREEAERVDRVMMPVISGTQLPDLTRTFARNAEEEERQAEKLSWLDRPMGDLYEMANKAMGGDPTELEEAGFMLFSNGPNGSVCTDHCSTQHQYAAGCVFRIRRRRTS